ncbi:NERD domain-containing protein [Bacillus sp. V3B]|uniref:nuclease-related domain-containing protein n=1 Tax=Bacillus sp. V3B TaxID=2804915 RepID=UPI00210B5502|nr:nuclease-related domain-containing protein [Bacillus sp. V3B]MCQ6274433.1 NERD domain-containing protein [Bacillus sp. V3B]
MGQLIKLQDYSSRYEQNIFHYPSRFVTLKKQQWEKLQKSWGNPEKQTFSPPMNQPNIEWEVEEKHPLLNKIKTLFNRKSAKETEQELSPSVHDFEKDSVELDVFPSFTHQAETIEELKQQFLNQLFDFQMKWATSTLTEKSFVNKKFFFDENLKFFLQRFPDTYLVLYQPVFLLKKATVEVETILISPTEVWCITFLEDQNSSVFVGSNKKFWNVRNDHNEKIIVNPVIAINRTETIVKNIFKHFEIDLPVHKVLLSRNGYIDFPAVPRDVQLVDQRQYGDWFHSLRSLKSPLKNTQLMGAKALLQFCSTSSIKRIEWEVVDKK